MASTQSPYFISQQQEPPYSSNNTPQEQSFNFNSKVSPSILLIIVILAVIFFVSGLLHLLVRFLLRPGGPAARRRGGPDDDDDTESVSALQGQLQQLFHLHDAGVDQSFIDSLPVFQYTSITGSNSAKRPFDCAVCLCEFEPLDKLRLLPKCSHAFHTECIDTWLLSHSTCPLCRASLLFSAANANAAANAENCSPIVLVLESGSSNASTEITTTQEFPRNEEPTSLRELIVSEQRESIVTVKLGKFTSVDGGVGSGGGEGASSSASVSISVSNSVDSRRCFSMGSFAYVMDESSNLRVPIRMPSVKKSSKSTISSLPGPKAGMIARAAMSECDCESRREFEFNAVATPAVVQGLNNNSAVISKKESFSISKIWLRGKKEKDTNTTSSSSCSVECSRRAFSFRFQRSVNNGNGNGNGGVSGEDLKCKNGKFPRRTVSEIGVARWEREGVEMGFEEESQSCNSLDSQSNPPSFARKTLLWLMGRQQNKVVHSSFDPNNP